MIDPFASLTYYRGRVALYAILKAMGVGVGDEIVTQAFTCLAVPEAIMATGARPIYVDIEASGFNMDVYSLEQRITPQVRAIVVQHTYGIPADMDRIVELAEHKGIPIVEDCCHTLISKCRGKTVGSFGVGSFYSFEWGKPVVAGIGGKALINDMHLLKRIQSQYEKFTYPSFLKTFRIQVQYAGFKLLYRPYLYWHVRSMFHILGSIGAAESNYNPIQEQSRIARDFSLKMSKAVHKRLVKKLRDLEADARHSRDVAAEYKSGINCPVVQIPLLPLDSDTVFARYPLISKDKHALLEKARKANVELADWYSTPVHPLEKNDLNKVYYNSGSCDNAETRCKQTVTLPTHQAVSRRDIYRTIKFFNEIVY
jgi:dTDP-4-amino-4,6-dideoxygalactose transaminase